MKTTLLRILIRTGKQRIGAPLRTSDPYRDISQRRYLVGWSVKRSQDAAHSGDSHALPTLYDSLATTKRCYLPMRTLRRPSRLSKDNPWSTYTSRENASKFGPTQRLSMLRSYQ